MALDRRQFLLIGGGTLAAGGAVMAFLAQRDRSPSVDITVIPQAPERPPKGSDLVVDNNGVLPQQHVATLSALVDAIYPGSVEVGAFDYILQQLRRRDMQSARRVLMRGAAQSQRVAIANLNMPLVKATAEQKVEVMQAMLGGAGAKGAFNPAEFVHYMVALTLEGMFSHPVYGGNVDGAGWKLIDYEGACRAPTLKAPL
ncbi:MAG: gluconate 2-dehydrogenase subunit 3 family protein [Myxococcota bacterium]